MVTGTFQVSSFDTYILFDPGSIHSYASPFFTSRFGEPPVLLNHLFWVSTPTKGALLVQLMFKSCVISMNRMDMLADLMLLEMVDFDAILVMNWLASYHATVDCDAKVVKFEAPNGPSFIFRGDSCLTPATLISSLATLRLRDKGNPRFFASVKNTKAGLPSID